MRYGGGDIGEIKCVELKAITITNSNLIKSSATLGTCCGVRKIKMQLLYYKIVLRLIHKTNTKAEGNNKSDVLVF